MDVAHTWQQKHHNGNGESMFLLSNRSGAFLSVGNLTKYNGLIWENEGFFKTIESFSIIGKLEKVTNDITKVTREFVGGTKEQFEFVGNQLIYTLKNYHGPLFIDLDVRKVDDESTFGRKYSVQHEGELLVVDYEKFADADMTQKDYALKLAIHGIKNFQQSDVWEPRTYEYDKKRADSSDFWIYRVGRMHVEGDLRLAVDVPREAIASEPIEGNLAEILSFSSLEALTVDFGNGGVILAGYPWFIQEWTRDELISLGAYIKAGRINFAKHVLNKYYDLLEKRGGFDAYFPQGGLKSADALGWLAKRTMDFLDALENDDLQFSAKELARFADIMWQATKKVPMRDGLVINGPGETWMDAPTGGDTREGASIEIQALHLCCLALCAKLQVKGARHREQEFKKLVKKKFFDGKLADNIGESVDFTARPNAFLAFYLYPHLLKLQEWRGVFNTLLDELWLEWGGLASISTKSKLFIDTYQGMKNESYHRGDSWYFVNCLSALCLHHFDSVHYRKYILKLKDAAVDDLLMQGAIGHCSEVSSASKQEFGGCFTQSWSAAMLYELLSDFH